MPVIEPTDIKDELAFGAKALGLSEANFDSLLQNLIRRETSRAEDAINVSLGIKTVIETVSRPASVNEFDLPLPRRPVQSVTSVSIDADRVGGPAVSPDDFAVHDTHLELLPSADRTAWPTGRRAVEVEWTHGYPENDAPEPIRGALIGLVRQALQEVEADGVSQESLDGHTVSYELGEAVVARHLARANQFDAPSYYDGSGVV